MSNSDENKCRECEGLWEDEDEKQQKGWVGCDSCDKWYHFTCAGYRRAIDLFVNTTSRYKLIVLTNQ